MDATIEKVLTTLESVRNVKLGKIMSWTLGGLYEWYRPRGTAFWDTSYVMVCHQYRPDMPEEGRSLASILAFYPRNSREIYKLVELWIDETTPFTGSCGGVALARDYLYVSDDDQNQGWVLGYKRSDLQTQLDAGREPGKVFTTSARGLQIRVNLPYTASGLYFDDDLREPRLWVSENFRSVPKDMTPFPAKMGRGTAYQLAGRRLESDTYQRPGESALAHGRRLKAESDLDRLFVAKARADRRLATRGLQSVGTKTPSRSVYNTVTGTRNPTPSATTPGVRSLSPTAYPSARAGLLAENECTYYGFEDGLLDPFVANYPELVSVVESADNIGLTTRVLPLTGTYMARIVAGAGANEYTTLSMVLQGPTGMRFSYDLLFDAGDYLPWLDDASSLSVVLTSSGSGDSLTTNSVTRTLWSSSIKDYQGFKELGASSWIRGNHTLPSAGTHVLSFRVRNVGDNEFPSALMVDNVQACALPADFVAEPSPSATATPNPAKYQCDALVTAALDAAEFPSGLPAICCTFAEYVNYRCSLPEGALPIDPMERAKLAGYRIDPFTGLLLNWGSSGGIVMQNDSSLGGPADGSAWGGGVTLLRPDREVNIGPDVKGAVYGYREYAGGPQYIILNRCPIKRGGDCKLEFHEIPRGIAKEPSSAGQALLDQFTGKKVVFSLKVGTGTKAKSQQNGGDARMDPGTGDPAITLVQVLRIPSAAQAIYWEPQPQGVVTSQRHLALTFSGCSNNDQPQIRQFGLDCEDNLRLMTFPVLRAFKPAVTANIVYLRIFYIDMFKPVW